MLARGRILVCLDYDGTISVITADVANARPIAGAREVVTRLAGDALRATVAVISGRRVSEVRRLLGIERGILFAGVHGLELMGADGSLEISKDALAAKPALERVRKWLSATVDARDDYVIEDKDVAIAFHYRVAGAERARGLRARLAELVTREPSLRIMHGKMVDEVMPKRGGGKAEAIRCVLAATGVARIDTAYFGDDTTDEDAFLELGPQALTVAVGEARISCARYRVDGPAEVVRELELLADALAAERAPGRSR